MIDYIKGQIVELTPTELVLDNQGIGYSILISLQTYEAFQTKTEAVAYIHHYIREDEELFFGFATKDERELFRLLISVSGIGVASARMMLSTLTSEEIRQAILAEDINKIKSVKGFGLKSAQRLVLELKDKVVKGEGSAESALFKIDANALVEEAKKDGLFAGVVESQEYYGLFIKYTIHAAGQTLKVVEKNGSVNILEPGDAVSLYIDREQIMSY